MALANDDDVIKIFPSDRAGRSRMPMARMRLFAREALTGRHAEQLKTTAAIYERDENRGADPLLVARLAEKLIARRRVGVRYTVGSRIQRFGMVLKRVLPATVFERIMKGTYGIR
jgi:hypothetical protein